MTATPEKVDRLAAAIRRVDGSHILGAAALAEALLDTGEVEVKVPTQPDPAPWPVPGSVAIATGNSLIIRVDGPLQGTEGWYAPTLRRWFTDDEVTVTSRAAVVSEADRDELADRYEQLASQASYCLPEEVTQSYLSAARLLREWFAAKLEGGA